jgi:hypothetical protein
VLRYSSSHCRTKCDGIDQLRPDGSTFDSEFLLNRSIRAAYSSHASDTSISPLSNFGTPFSLAVARATAKSGKPYKARIVDGKIREMTDYVDTALIDRALG